MSPFPDRVVAHALMGAVEPDLERFAIHHSYACRVGKGHHRALRQAQRWARKYDCVYKGDIRRFFASISHARVLHVLRRRLENDPICTAIERMVRSRPNSCAAGSGRGLAIGSLVSQHLANLYLGVLDHWLTDQWGCGATLRYMDDFLVFAPRRRLRELARALPEFLNSELELELNRKRSQMMPVHDGIPFLGFVVFPALIQPSRAVWRRFWRSHWSIEQQLAEAIIDEAAAARSAGSRFAHVAAFATYRARRRGLGLPAGKRGRDPNWLQPRDSRRLLEAQPAQCTGCEPRQERAVEAQRQCRLSPCELNTAAGVLIPAAEGPEASCSRMRCQRQGVDQIPSPGTPEEAVVLGKSSGLIRGAKAERPGGGACVAAGSLVAGRDH